jgi:iron complex outermembrane receptor protein
MGSSRNSKSIKLLSCSAVALAAAYGSPAWAQQTASAESTESVIVTGTRQTGMTAADSPAPVQVIGADVLSQVGQPDLMQSIAQNVPSFNAQGYGGDTAALTLSAALRGLNPDDTLVLINGKRRHSTANLQVDGGSPFQGSATTDLSFIPVGAIDHIEVLQDGAAAQYGSDAIAGVVNIITKTNDSGGTLSATGGQYYGGDGDTGAAYLNKGFSLGDGYLNVTGEMRYHGFSRQGGADQRFSNPDGTLKPGLSAIETTNIPLTPGYPNMNNIYGDPESKIYNVFYDGGYNLGENVQFYSFGSYGHRDDSAYENYRTPDKVSGVTSTGVTVFPIPLGFSPKEAIREDDYSFTAGLKGAIAGWNWDLSTTYGDDHDLVSTVNSANAQLFPVLQALSATPITPQRNFYDGSYDSSQWTNNIDISRNVEIGLASPLNIAFGGEARHDTFTIGQGEPDSYFGAGAQSFTGYGPTDAGGHARDSYAGYVDFAASIISGLYVDVAGRYEHYTDFGDTTVGKVTARYDFSPVIGVRGTFSTGFRAPTLQEEFYSGTNVSPSFAQVQLPANSAAATIAGFAPLKPELSHNYSAGIVLHPEDGLQITADAYEIDIANRIVGSGFLLGSVLNPAGTGQTVISQAILNSITAHGNTLDSGISYAGIQLFTNGVNTRTRGAEMTATYASDFDEMGHVNWSFGFNYNDTAITKLNPLPPRDADAAIGQTSLLSPNATSSLTTATPKYKFVLGGYWTLSQWSVNLREEIYGPTSQFVSLDGSGTGNGATLLSIPTTPITDLDVGYNITDAIKIDLGANNLFDQKPDTVPNVASGGGVKPADGNNVYGEPDQFSPFGINGGYYYGRVTFNF